MFVFAWLPFVLAGAAGQPALDHELARHAARARARARRPARATAPVAVATRRELMGRALAVTGAGTLVLGGLASLLKGGYHGASSVRKLAGGASTTPTPAPRTTASAPPAGAVPLGASSALSRGQAALYRDPGDGNADIVIRQPGGQLTAFSAICPHAGCQVSYGGGELYCPCHGSTFDPTTGAVRQGPAVTGLPTRKVLERALYWSRASGGAFDIVRAGAQALVDGRIPSTGLESCRSCRCLTRSCAPYGAGGDGGGFQRRVRCDGARTPRRFSRRGVTGRCFTARPPG